MLAGGSSGEDGLVAMDISDSPAGNGTEEKGLMMVGCAPALECGERVASDSSEVAVDAYVRLGVCSSGSSSSASGLLKIQSATVEFAPKPISRAVSRTEARRAFESRLISGVVFERGPLRERRCGTKGDGEVVMLEMNEERLLSGENYGGRRVMNWNGTSRKFGDGEGVSDLRARKRGERSWCSGERVYMESR